jgi:hypothetical protein
MQEREALLARTEAEVERWTGYVDTLLEAFHGRDEAPPILGSRMEALRNKRDCVLTKVEALKRHKHQGWARARKELDEARRELRECWRTVISTLQKESLFV